MSDKAQVKLFGAEWCQGCKFIKVMLTPIADVEYIDIDTEEGVKLCLEYGVQGIPTYINEDGGRGYGVVKNVSELKKILEIE